MRCPRTEPATLEPESLKGVAVHVCHDCRGILMTRAELELLTSAVGSRGASSKSRPDYFARLREVARFTGERPSIACPSCKYGMYEVERDGLVVDFCLNCQAVWFDEGELHKTLELARKSGGIDLTPADLDGNDTAALIDYMLRTVSDG